MDFEEEARPYFCQDSHKVKFPKQEGSSNSRHVRMSTAPMDTVARKVYPPTEHSPDFELQW